MKIIQSITDELKDISTEFNNGIIDKDSVLLKLELLKAEVLNIEINYDRTPFCNIEESTVNVLNQLLRKHQYKAITSLDALKQAVDSKRKYNAIARNLIGNKLYFAGLYRTISRTSTGWIDRNNLSFFNPNLPVFILNNMEGKGDNNE